MLVLTRRRDERIVLKIAENFEVVITVCDVDGNKVRIGVEAPSRVSVLREELIDRRAMPDAKARRNDAA